MPDTITLPQAAHEFGLDARTVARIRRVLGRRGRVGHLLERANVIVYERALVVATIHADQERQRLRADRERFCPTKACGRCGTPIPHVWILDRCHACLRRAA